MPPGCSPRPKLPDIAGVDGFDGITIHTARWDHTPGPDRQARRDHRHRRVGRPGHPRDRSEGRAPHGVSAHADLVLPQVRRAAAQGGPLGDADARRDGAAAAGQPDLRRVDVHALGAVLHGFSVGQARRGDGTGVLAQARSTTRSCARSSRRSTPSAASGPASTTPICRRSTATTSSWSPIRSTRSPPTGVATVEGDHHDVDVLILATGFKVMDIDSLTYESSGAAACR